ncbi:hypothetical protein SAMN04487949_1538 [Halogranum gelatinilyticum]|uniref:DUF2064 domain-containing protein n=1 Tax=Halogranum gelatinilyticum TaxID=660521 RepID=A0A1G9SXM0_9EURY|nr:DUF2064 domain-containing protein [Halogranum gelatinilyticum]SDM40181.1 hypothetical protein SAMN04487949_1538 [Halogranum gelatinilyticum]
MTTIAVFVDPPREGLVGTELAETSPLTSSEAADFYAACIKDAILAAERSGGELLVNYRPDDLIPEEFHGEQSAEAEVRALVADALGDTSDVRFEVQVGSTFDARAGNTVSHLLREEGVQSVAIVRGNAPMLLRTAIDSAAMKLRTNDVLLGPSTEGRVYYAAFREAIDFEGAFETPELDTLADRADDTGHTTEFIPMQPVVETGDDLATFLPLLESRVTAERIVPKHTATLVRELGLRVETDDAGDLTVVRD